MKKFLAILIGLSAISFGGWWYLASHPQTQNKPPSGVSIAATYACRGGKIIQAQYYKGAADSRVIPGEPPHPTGSVRLDFIVGNSVTLPQTISADGARYANADESFIFWGKGNGALVLENGAEKNYTGCVQVAKIPDGSDLSQMYADPNGRFSLRLPAGFSADPSYQYEIDPSKNISGVKFIVPSSLADGTNLSKDSYVSIENLPKAVLCTADLFLYGTAHSGTPMEITEGGTTFSVASSTDAGAGNRYEEIVYALPDTNPCTAIRYFIHYSVFENYPPGTVKEFNQSSLLRKFDQIRSTWIVNQPF